MERRLLSAFLAVMMVLTMAPVAFAADDAENTVGDTGSSESAPAKTLQGQINEAENGATITLNDNYTEDITIPADKVITLNLNGNKLTNVQSDTITVTKGAKLTIEGAGTVDNVTHGMAAIYNNGTTTLNGGTYTRSLETGDKVTPKNSYYNILNHGIMTIDKDVTVKQNGNYSSLVANGYYNYSATEKGDRTAYIESVGQDAPQLTINNGTFSGGINTIKNDDNAILTINNGEFSNVTQAVVQNNNIATVNGGIFNAPNYHVLENRKFNGNYNAGELTVTGGNFTGSIMVTSGATTSITGGTFSSDVSAYVAEGYVQNNGTVEQLGETNAVAEVGDTYYKTLADAVAAAKDGDTVTLLNNTVEDVVIPADKTITLDLNGKKIVNSTTAQDSKVANDARKHTITNNGTLTIMDSVGGGVVDNVSHGRAALYNNGTITEIKGGKFTRSVDNSTDSESANGNSWYVVYNAEGATISKISNGEFLALGHFSSLFSNCGTIDEISGGTFTQDHFIAFKNEGTVNKISGGVFSSADESCIQNWGTIGEICGGTITAGSLGIWNLSSDKYTSKGTVEKISDGVISGTKEAIRLSNYDVEDLNKSADSLTNWASATIVGGKVNGALKVGNGTRVSISGGYFTTDPSDYVASGYVAGTSDVSGYSYKVVAKTETGNVEVKPDVAKPEVKVDKIPQKDQETVKAAAATVSAPTLGAAAVDEAQKIDKSKADELVAKANKVTGDKKLYVQSALKVEPTAYDAANKTLALEITPQYRVVASTADTADKIKLDGDTKNAQVVQDYQTMNITKATVVTMELPTGFAVADGDKLSIQHTKNGTVEYYTGTVTKKDDKFYLTFTTNGFSPFVISVPAASIGENVYPTLQAAVENVKKNETIKLAKDVDEAIVVTVAKSINFKVNTNNKQFKAAKNIVAGSNTTVKVTGESSPYTYEFTYTKPSSSSSGGSSSGKTTYKVTTSAVNNGGVNASPSNAEKGAAITITLSPDKGYKLDKLTVTDGSGKTVSTVKKSDTVYTFTMPASAVKVGVSYVKATETPSKTKFNDVSANDWFASAVDYVTGKGMMNGTADNTFSPKANTTRGMVVTVLYRLENQPSTSAASFTDVASGAYYANAVAWANANGIVSGYGSGKFGPNDKVTREQLAAILYRYAQYKKYDVSVGEDTNILSYDDAQSISTYAIPAIQWACGAGVVTGKSGSKLDPKGNATRAEVAAMLMRFCENVK